MQKADDQSSGTFCRKALFPYMEVLSEDIVCDRLWKMTTKVILFLLFFLLIEMVIDYTYKDRSFCKRKVMILK